MNLCLPPMSVTDLIPKLIFIITQGRKRGGAKGAEASPLAKSKLKCWIVLIFFESQ